jgi:hypothetical protein
MFVMVCVYLVEVSNEFSEEQMAIVGGEFDLCLLRVELNIAIEVIEEDDDAGESRDLKFLNECFRGVLEVGKLEPLLVLLLQGEVLVAERGFLGFMEEDYGCLMRMELLGDEHPHLLMIHELGLIINVL